MHDRDYTISVLQKLQEMDIKLPWMTLGSATLLATLKPLPHTLKVDREFSNDITTNQSAAIIKSILASRYGDWVKVITGA